MKCNKIGVIGLGYVGMTTALFFANNGNDVICIDNNKIKIDMLKSGKMPFYEPGCDKLLGENYSKLFFYNDYKNIKNITIFFICVGTPLNKENTLEINNIINVCSLIKSNIRKNQKIIICIRSTILPKTCEKIERIISDKRIIIAHNPEFLSQGNAINDTFYASRILIGANDNNTKNKLFSLYKSYIDHFSLNIPIIEMSREDAEMVKFVANSYLAMRISFINEISNLCEILNINIDNVINGVKYDNRIGGHYLKYGIGYGGSCLPKDTKAIVDFSQKMGSALTLIDNTIKVNDHQLKKCYTKIVEDFETLKNKNIAILGVTFKANTDDVRNSPSIYIVKKLLKEKANINVYDPKGLKNFKSKFNNKINYYNNISKCIKSCEIIIILSEWDEIVNYKFTGIDLKRKIFIYDFKSCIKKKIKISNSNIKYWCVGDKNE